MYVEPFAPSPNFQKTFITPHAGAERRERLLIPDKRFAAPPRISKRSHIKGKRQRAGSGAARERS